MTAVVANELYRHTITVYDREFRLVATIEDRGSRNGTFVDGKRISTPRVLADGSVIVFGSERATFRQWSDEAAMDTEPVRPRS